MNGGGEWVVALPFYLSIAQNRFDELSVGPLWAPGIVESMRVQVTGVPMVVQARAQPTRLPLLEDQTSALASGGEFIWRVFTDAPAVQDRSGYRVMGTEEREVSIGQVVAFAPWWLVVRVVSGAVGTAGIYGTFKVVLRGGLRPGEWVDPPNGRRAEDNRLRFLGRNPFRSLRGVS